MLHAIQQQLSLIAFQGVGGMLETLHAKQKLPGLDQDQQLFYQSAIYAYEVSKHSVDT